MIVKELLIALRTSKEYTAFGMWGFFGLGVIITCKITFNLLPIIGLTLVVASFINHTINIFKK